MTTLDNVRRRPMVRWYNPINLWAFAWSYVRGLWRGHTDHREAHANADLPRSYASKPTEAWKPFIDLADGKDEQWLDFVADGGDGYDPTYTIAYLGEAPELSGLAGAGRDLPRADTLMFGGDLAYPIANSRNLLDRLLLPYDEARLAWKQQARTMLAIPGNHDWYDDLRAFKSTLIDSELDTTNTVPAQSRWHTPQRRSYFCARLAQNWWVLAVDIERTGDIDDHQLAYFKRALRYADAYPQPRAIVVVHDPLWSQETQRKFGPPKKLTMLTDWFEQQQADIKLWLAGDLHFYRHEQDDDGRHWITCGGGGAFLHPTHAEDDPEPAGKPKVKVKWFPEPQESRKIANRGLWFRPHNPVMQAVFAMLYVASFLQGAPIAELSAWSTWLLPALLIGISTLYALTQGLIFGLTMGLAHGIAQAALYAVPAVKLQGVVNGWVVMAALGGVAAPLLLGWYLWSSLRLFRKHKNDAFSALRWPHYKSFLRLHVDSDAKLTVYPIGVRHVPDAAQLNAHADGTPLTPANAGFEFELLHGKPIKVGR